MDNLSALGGFDGYLEADVGRERGADSRKNLGERPESQDLPQQEEKMTGRPRQQHRESHDLGSCQDCDQEAGNANQNATATARLLNSLSGLLNSLSLHLGGSHSENAGSRQSVSEISQQDAEARDYTKKHTSDPAEMGLCRETSAGTSLKHQDPDVVLLIYDLETTGIGKTETIGICELGNVARCPAYSFVTKRLTLRT